MNLKKIRVLLIAGSVVALAGCMKQVAHKSEASADSNTAAKAGSSSDPITSAEAAAPASIAHDAAVVSRNPDGTSRTLREGKNGWTCMSDNPVTPGPDPMCMDANAAKWVAAWIVRKPPPSNTVGVMYMLSGGTDFSNVDPYAKKPTEEDKWIKTGPHIMVVGSKEILAGYPSGRDPDTSAPFVMWAGTPYAHLMIPVK